MKDKRDGIEMTGREVGRGNAVKRRMRKGN